MQSWKYLAVYALEKDWKVYKENRRKVYKIDFFFQLFIENYTLFGKIKGDRKYEGNERK